MLSVAVFIGALTLLPDADARTSPKVRTVPLFSDFPVQKLYTGPVATPKLESASDKEHLQALLGRTPLTPNFAGQFTIVQFRTGSGPIGAVMVDSRSGSLFHLPREIVKNGFFIDRTDCLPSLRGVLWAKLGDEEDPSAPVSFKTDSELLVMRQCRAHGPVDRSYYRWHGRRWHLVKRLASPPPPVY